MAIAVLIGFGPTYYLPGLSGSARTISGNPPSPLIHLHAALFTGWVVLFIVQTSLVARRSVSFHRKLGYAVACLAAGMFFVGSYTALKGAAAGTTVPGLHPFTFFAIPFFDMVMFASFIIAAMLLRRNKEAHKPLMLLAYISIVVAAVARFPGVLQRGPLAFYGLTMIFLAIASL